MEHATAVKNQNISTRNFPKDYAMENQNKNKCNQRQLRIQSVANYEIVDWRNGSVFGNAPTLNFNSVIQIDWAFSDQ